MGSDEFYKNLNKQLEEMKLRLAVDDEKFERLKEIGRNLGFSNQAMQSNEHQKAAAM